jgi:hypothetical protein
MVEHDPFNGLGHGQRMLANERLCRNGHHSGLL